MIEDGSPLKGRVQISKNAADGTHGPSQISAIITDRDTSAAILTLIACQATQDKLEQLAKHPNTPLRLLEQLLGQGSEKLRSAIAARRNLEEVLIWQLASDPSPRVRYRLANNAALPVFALEALAEDEHVSVSSRAERTLSRRHETGFDKVIHWLLPTANVFRRAG
jgi:hypothetical protein